MTQKEWTQRLQLALGVVPDGDFGPITQAESAKYEVKIVLEKKPDAPMPEAPQTVAMGTPMARIKPKGVTTRGIDVSHYQPQLDFASAKAAGFEFVFLKASEGSSFADKSFKDHRRNARAAGMLVGHYHFFRPLVDPELQAVHFCAQVSKIEENELPPVCDLEDSDGVNGPAVVERAKEFCEHVERILGVRPIVYTGPYYFQSLGKTAGTLGKYPLWIAHYGTSAPLTPPPWGNWDFWQYSETEKIPGKAGIDANLFNGSLADLKAKFVKGSG
jgi:lysozyme